MKTYFALLLSGIAFATLLPLGKDTEIKKATQIDTPDQNRFVKVTLVQGQFTEPTEIAVLPNLDVLVSQRRGELMLYKNATRTLIQAGKLDVYFKTSVPDVNAEEGLLGIAVDPKFAANQYVYALYSPAGKSVNRLSRFKLVNDRITTATEKVILEFYSQREICCHTGGSLAFGPDGLLYISTGDNSTPFDVPKQQYVNKGYAPLDNREGLHQYDARRSAGNTNDLRGKILRIRVNDDGSYGIPDGNLFAKNDPKAKPEIYVMGNRNPYRISVDQKTGFLYWGEVGPDAGNDDPARGPRGYDEVNQAKKAGNFGWPLFVGNNYPYRAYDYTNGSSGDLFDPNAPKNDSPNNTGLSQLPPAQPAFIWYPYGESPDFPQVGTGGRTAMAGPVYYTKPGASPYPAYYNGKLLIYEWVRGWVKAVTMSPQGDYLSMEPFMANIPLAAPIDMEQGRDGKLYILEYGKGWFAKNPDAALVRIDYLEGNRPPVVSKLNIKKTSGLLPYKLEASVEATDPDGDALTYVWSLGNGIKKTTTVPNIQHTFSKAGQYSISVQVVDKDRASAKSPSILVSAGNAQPVVDIATSDNKSFFFPGVPVNYNVKVTDPGATVNRTRIFVSSAYNEGTDMAGAKLGHQEVAQTLVGKALMQKSDCSTCHKVNEKSIGPAFALVSAKYQAKPDAAKYLSGKIIKGSTGVWGEVPMPAHSPMKTGEATQIAEWIMSLKAKSTTAPSLPAAGKITPPASLNGKQTVLSIKASYSDLGGTNLKPLTSTAVLNLRNSVIDAKDLRDLSGFGRKDANGTESLIFPEKNGWIRLKQVDLSHVAALATTLVAQGDTPYTIEIRLDSENGTVIGSGKHNDGQISLNEVTDGKMHDVYMIVKTDQSAAKDRPAMRTLTIVPKK
ncbi:PQQ-dependent sugar dehydrogenase [Pedobacter faecalis]|uniref:PQQ-dependent sugar dehydrogenase n=1 Tax=Pedobacter faecalis TaxID=3041495 RepID=UPI00254D500B|nr:PQQ-dependent sugar dehydrogenase [Pedobacter sp. ELA7]